MGGGFGLLISRGFGDEFDSICRLRGEGFGEERGDVFGEVLGEGNELLVLFVLLFRNGNIGIVDNFCVRVVIDDCG